MSQGLRNGFMILALIGLTGCGGGGGGNSGGGTPPPAALDTDRDGLLDSADNCPAIANPGQTDSDGDGIGNACDTQNDTDSDGDGIRDEIDNCPAISNPDQTDADLDGTGDACETTPTVPPVETVISTGDIFAVSGYDAQSDLIAEAIAQISAIRASGQSLLRGLYGSSPVNYSVDRRTSFVQYPAYEAKRNDLIPILQTGSSRVHAVAGQYKQSFARFSYFGSAPPVLFNNGESLGFEAVFERLVAWLLGDDPGNTGALSSAPKIVLARTHSTGTLQTWFETHLPAATVTICSDADPLASCSVGADLMVMGKTSQAATAQADASELDRLLRANVPALYLHGAQEHDTVGSDALSALIGADMPYAGNYFRSEEERNSNWANVDAMIDAIGADLTVLATVLDKLDRGNFSYNFQAGLSNGSVDPSAVPNFEDEFLRAAEFLRSRFNTLDDRQIAVFSEPQEDFRLDRILALIGDELRQDASFPMDIIATDQNTFLPSYLADHLIYGFRDINPLQPDRGFHGRRTQAEVTPGAYSAHINTRFTGRKPTGAYALPGKTFTVTRTDANSDIDVEIYWNLQFPNGTFEFRTGNRYDMPKYLRSQEVNLSPGESITVSSPYGGVIQINHDRGSSDAQDVTLSFQGVGQHPFYNGPSTAAAFTAGLAAGIYDWTEIAAPEHYVTEPLDLMADTVQAMADDLGWNIDEVARVGSVYYYNEMARLSGYRGFDIPVQPAEITSFCTANGWECSKDEYHGISGSVEGNIRQSITNCGSAGGCSNQPVTYTWNWNPLGAGPVHERGHHLEGNSGASYHTFAPLDGHHLTNTWRAFLPYAYYRETGNTGACDIERNEHRTNGTRFQILQDARNSANVQQYMADKVWNAGQRSAMTRAMITQFAAHAENQGRFNEGWNYLPLMLIAAREFKQKLDEGEAAFDAAKARYGFGQFTFAEAQDMVASDEGQRSWALVAYSFITGRDQRNYWRMLGWDYSARADSQLSALFPLLLSTPAAEQFYAFDDICSVDNAIAVPVDGVSTWPDVRPTVY